MDYQPIMNIGMIGHVSDGKTTITKKLTGTLTQKHSSEKQKNLTIRLGYANAKICKCTSCAEPECYFSVSSDIFDYICPNCNSNAILMNHISFVDCPGHNMLMATMLNGTSVMDYTILVESVSNINFPAPQTLEHFKCIKNMKIKNILTILNKIDLIKKDKALELCTKLQNFLDENNCDSKIIPLSATHEINIDILCMILAHLPKPSRNYDFIKMPVIRSFNINKPGTNIIDLEGGVIGGSIQTGKIKCNDDLLLVPGMIVKDDNINDNINDNITDKFICKPIKCKIESINSEKNNLLIAVAGGLIGIKMNIDPGLTADDGLIGNVLVDKINGIVSNKFQIKTNVKLSRKNNYIFNINSNNINGKILKKNKENDYIIEVNLDSHQYISHNDIITISINNNDNITLVDYCIFNINLPYNNILVY
jgi:translation initiation factor 2 subunit 3